MLDASPTVFIVDGDHQMRASLSGLIEAMGLRVQCFASAGDFLAHPPWAGPCCLVLDVELPDLDGLELQARVAAEREGMPLVFVASCREVRTCVRAMKAGALEFLTKPADTQELCRAIEAGVDRSRVALARAASLRVLRERFDSLSRREREVMTLVVCGRLNKQIGGILGISEITVKAHRGKVMRKMAARSLAELVDMARRIDVGGTRPEAPASARTTWAAQASGASAG